jgi:hypothetical protein
MFLIHSNILFGFIICKGHLSSRLWCALKISSILSLLWNLYQAWSCSKKLSVQLESEPASSLRGRLSKVQVFVDRTMESYFADRWLYNVHFLVSRPILHAQAEGPGDWPTNVNFIKSILILGKLVIVSKLARQACQSVVTTYQGVWRGNTWGAKRPWALRQNTAALARSPEAQQTWQGQARSPSCWNELETFQLNCERCK